MKLFFSARMKPSAVVASALLKAHKFARVFNVSLAPLRNFARAEFDFNALACKGICPRNNALVSLPLCLCRVSFHKAIAAHFAGFVNLKLEGAPCWL